ncbi:MAG: Holliday junction resolvase RuvX [Candidatus Cardinium sp.]|uniref:Holliday junction resolvase RuvX n=1 Tax=Cardinium endosymbiont of Dermatophagoides farinae TaxID=2597823 RepID=UPI001183A4D8|nr:Holliday junction resolvase RuvX [Cardinium endosymbiont of Dermatophagoides farinae]TSJ81044.1 Holliday junction resolvase RuvX [Cardinium endosymbiont of Dermatophagoides farinae]UWW97074.1 MAG: Holliday junction resolvase RuvX [Candidatus Cardinium sp.]
MEENLGRIIAIDYGLKRVGIAVTDPLQIIATSLTTIATPSLFLFLKDYLQKESVVAFVMGMPKGLDGMPSKMSRAVEHIGMQLKKKFPAQSFYYQDERFTSKLAMQGLYQAGYSKKDRMHKNNIDKVSAAIILQSFLNRKECL